MSCELCNAPQPYQTQFPSCRQCDYISVCLDCATDIDTDADVIDGDWHGSYTCVCKACSFAQRLYQEADEITCYASGLEYRPNRTAKLLRETADYLTPSKDKQP